MPLKVAILQRGLTQDAIAYQTGIHYTALSRIVNGWREPTDAQRAQLAKVLGVSEKRLFTRARQTAVLSPRHRTGAGRSRTRPSADQGA
jgi:transcriptional regulator with XRE-family HTH domain